MLQHIEWSIYIFLKFERAERIKLFVFKLLCPFVFWSIFFAHNADWNSNVLFKNQSRRDFMSILMKQGKMCDPDGVECLNLWECYKHVTTSWSLNSIQFSGIKKWFHNPAGYCFIKRFLIPLCSNRNDMAFFIIGSWDEIRGDSAPDFISTWTSKSKCHSETQWGICLCITVIP